MTNTNIKKTKFLSFDGSVEIPFESANETFDSGSEDGVGSPMPEPSVTLNETTNEI